MSAVANRSIYAVLTLLLFGIPARAHDGPPFPIIVDKKIGPCIVSLWTHPDIGTGTFWVIVDPPPGSAIPKDLRVEIAVQPVDGRIPERRFVAPVDDSSNQLQYKALIPFDRQEFVRAQVFLTSSKGSGDASAKVEITPVGPASRWSLVLFIFPFAGVGFLWFRAVSVRRSRRKVVS
ncbi:MAG TPA: hypothetical protein VG273_01645 [Bryobacteraceae bacterium]|jgi:hypothetical protein|nr:hypothetical protein [Bryobacteraceae bacterium]